MCTVCLLSRLCVWAAAEVHWRWWLQQNKLGLGYLKAKPKAIPKAWQRVRKCPASVSNSWCHQAAWKTWKNLKNTQAQKRHGQKSIPQILSCNTPNGQWDHTGTVGRSAVKAKGKGTETNTRQKGWISRHLDGGTMTGLWMLFCVETERNDLCVVTKTESHVNDQRIDNHLDTGEAIEDFVCWCLQHCFCLLFDQGPRPGFQSQLKPVQGTVVVSV